MPKLIHWDVNKAKKEVSKRMEYATRARQHFEGMWQRNEHVAFNSDNVSGYNPYTNNFDMGLSDVEGTGADVNVSYAFKNLRFLHAQLSANPPSVVPRPATNDQDDRRKADAADRLVRHAIRTYQMQERIDKVSLNCLTYGAGFMKTIWDSEKGDILQVVNEEEGEFKMTGDICFSTPSPWDIWIDPDAEHWEEARYVIERQYIPYDEAVATWPEAQELLEKARIVDSSKSGSSYRYSSSKSTLNPNKYDVVEIFQYWEKGLPTNGYVGRFFYHLKDGTVLGELMPNPFRFKPAGESDVQFERAELPYHMFTDIDVPNTLWSKSFMEYVAPLQELMNRLDSTNLDNIQAHGLLRMILPEGSEITEMTNSPLDVVKITGSQPPHFMQAPSTLPLVDKFRDQMKIGVDDMSGVNEAMFGQQSREQSGFSMQYANNQGNMIRRRLFNKYAMFVESVYKAYLNIVRKHWKTDRVIQVLGKEKAFETIDIKGADIDGGFDLVVEYGASLSLDPTTRREEIMSMMPLFEKAGVSIRTILQLFKLNELEGIHDHVGIASDRQREYFEEMLATGRYIPPGEFEDHVNMLEYALGYIMTTEYKYLEDDEKELIKQHIRDRKDMQVQEMMPAAPGPGADLPNVAAPGAMPAQGPVMTEQEVPAEQPPISLGPGDQLV